MKTALILATTLVTTLALGSTAFAAGNSAAYCLRGQSGATQGTSVCGYQTMAQCMAAKAGQNDQCFPNPAMKRTTTGSGSSKH
jgi:uncharacterized protein DUF3551